ncbi:MAG: alfa-L-rhamnosidase RamA [Ruminococcaceae bacterium]|nr:alfa-L-rhamnosidase RamA [Oscillospiraceae bacterium]
MIIEQLRVQHLTSPLGARMEKPIFSYAVSGTVGKKQKSARITVSEEPSMKTLVFDSGEREDISSLAFEANLALRPRTRYYWQVEVTSDNGEKGRSEIAFFETGKREEPWAGKWIKTPFDASVNGLFHKRFSVRKDIASARLYICGLGVYEAEINGEKAGDECLAPFFTSYNKHIQYQSYDVTSLLKEGENAIGVMLGDGWYLGRFGWRDKTKNLYGDSQQLIAELRIAFSDGSEQVIASDESWLCHASPITFSNIYDGEHYDARLEVADWSGAGCDTTGFVAAVEADAPKAPLSDRLSPPVRVVETLNNPALLKTPKGELVLDFGQLLTGWIRFESDLPAGREVVLECGELLQQDCFYNENLRTAEEKYIYISSGKKASVRPHFTFYGFRFVRVTGMSEQEIASASFAADVIHSDLGRIGSLETSNEKVNRLVANAYWGQRGNFLDVPTDCPQRDERMGWTGDAQVFAPTASFTMYTPAFFRKYLYDMRMEQSLLDGAVPHVVPDVLDMRHRVHGNGIATDFGSCAWSDAATVIPWTVYCFYGDKSLLRETYPGMKQWVDYMRREDEERCGNSRLRRCGFHFADWLALDNPDKTSSHGGTESFYVATAYYYYSASLTAKAAKALGLEEDYAYYTELAEEIKEAFRKEYYTPGGRLAMPTQTAHAVALYMGLAPQEHRARTVADLKKRLDDKNVHLDTGFVGTYQLCAALTANGLADYAYTLLLNEDFPSWLYEVNMGATTVWERWNSVMPDGLVSGTGMNSMNHYAYGCVVEWMYRTMAGLNPCEEAPGFKKVEIRPIPDKRFDFVRCSYDSAAGRYESGWKREGDATVYTLTIPFDAQAEFVLPQKAERVTLNGKNCAELTEQGRVTLAAGVYEIRSYSGKAE